MALTWDAREIDPKLWDALADDHKRSAVFQMLHACVGPQLTEHNITEYVARVRVFEETCGPLLAREEDGRIVSAWTDEQLLGLVGLRSNVSYAARGPWLRGLFIRHLDDLARRAAKEFQRVNNRALIEPPDTVVDAKLREFNTPDRLRGAIEAHAMDVCASAGIELDSYLLELDWDAVVEATQAVGAAITKAVAEQRAEDED